ncbi:MAG: tripartite tricarboxylate transporter substrate binding protein [Burkholderiales bacterium]|nr:tripartite tricarboxylate transporter substrate binding protein [Burkholderiales bacterium]
MSGERRAAAAPFPRRVPMRVLPAGGVVRAVLLLLAVALAAPAQAQEAYPSRPVRILTPTAAGGNIDIMARALAERFAAAWGQGVVVEPRPGANGMLAAGAVAKAPADGHTILFSHSALVQNLLLQPNPPYKLADLAPVTMLALFPIAYGVNTALGVNSLAELIALAKARPRTLSFGSYGTGSGAHIIGAALNRAAGIDLTHVPYKGEVPAVTDMLSGQVSSAYGSVGYMARQIGSGKVRLIAVASAQRLKSFPDVPTFAEAGFPALNLPGWGGLFVPAGTPPAVIARINAEAVRAVQSADLAERINGMGFVPVGNGAEAFAASIRSEFERWETAIRENQIRLD